MILFIASYSIKIRAFTNSINISNMKKNILIMAATICTVSLLLVSCSTPVGLTSWKNPQRTDQVSRIVVMVLFDKLSYTQPFEEQLSNYFDSQNLKSIRSLDFLVPYRKYSNAELQKKFDSLGVDGVLLVTCKGTDILVDYNQGFYGGYMGRWGGFGGPVSATSIVNLRAKLYTVKGDQSLWAGDLSLTNPDNVTSSAKQIAQAIFADWLKNNLLKNPPPPTRE